MSTTFVLFALAMTVTSDPHPIEPEDATCELHIWPSEDLVVQTHGMWDGFRAGISGGVIGAANTPERRVERSEKGAATIAPQQGDPLSTQDQARLISAAAIAPLLDLTKHVPVIHETALESRTIRNTSGKYVADGANCYADLVVDDVVYSREWANGIKLKSFLRFRDFGTDGVLRNSFGSWVQTGLKLDPKEKPEHASGFEAELNAAYASNFSLFADSIKAAAQNAKKKR